MRADILLVEKKLCSSRQKAKDLIVSGCAFVNGFPIRKPSQEIMEGAVLTVNTQADVLRYVGRGGLKLEGAVKVFDLTLKNAVCMDIGASTGGFTDCLLQNGAARVYAVDVGHGQLVEKLAQDKRVINLEGTNLRELSAQLVPEQMDFICTDVSFISLSYVFPTADSFLKPDGKAVFLIKPQFEAGKQDIGKNGIVKNPAVHRKVLRHVLSTCIEAGFSIYGLAVSPICGGDGNIEYLLYFGRQNPSRDYSDVQLKMLIQNAFQGFKHQ